METVLPKRKSHHLQGYDYSQNGAYFITICTHQRRMLFGPNRAPVGADSISARMAARVFREIIGQYPTVQCHYFVVMPNHFHALVEIQRPRADMESAPTALPVSLPLHEHGNVSSVSTPILSPPSPFVNAAKQTKQTTNFLHFAPKISILLFCEQCVDKQRTSQ